MKNRPTVRDIARQAGVSIGTVSRALKDQSGLSEATRQRVRAVAESLGYDLKNLRHSRMDRLLFLVHRVHMNQNPFFSEVLQGAESACRAEGISLALLALGPGDPIAELLYTHEADGMLCAGFFEPEVLEILRATGKPMALIDTHHTGLATVNPDNEGGAFAITQHLIATGRKRIAFVAASLAHYSIRLRNLGYRRALFEAGILADPALDIVLDGSGPLEAQVETALRRLLALPEPPDALFAFNDQTAITAMRCARRLGVAVPQALAFAGFDNIDATQLADPPLTTIAVDKRLLGIEGVRLLLNQADARHETILPVTLIQRASTANH